MTDVQAQSAESSTAPEATARAHKPASPSTVHRLPSSVLCPLSSVLNPQPSTPQVALLTAGRDKPYALGLASALIAQGLTFDFIGSDAVDSPELHDNPQVNYLKLRNQAAGASLLKKMTRVLVYYYRLVRYAAAARPLVFHILWNNKFEWVDRTLLMVFYKLLGKRIVFTAHNVNAGTRDANDSGLNRLSLKIQYRLCDHIFVHTEKMKAEMVFGFRVSPGKVTVIPFGINNTVPSTALTPLEAKRKLGINQGDKTVLFFGHIAPYKGLEFLIEAFKQLAPSTVHGPPPSAPCPPSGYRLVIAGRPKNCEDYWRRIQGMISPDRTEDRIIQRIDFIPDEETELYFKAADVLVLPYTHVFQSGVLFLAYSFGLPVIAADVGSLKDEIIEGRTGFGFPAKDSTALAKAIETYFSSDLYINLTDRRQEIRNYANERYSWTKVAAITTEIYSNVLES
jgi:D-inositol-3-phosphate glycosyltransferase